MIISNQKNAFDIKIRETILTKVSTVKFLGVTLDENITFKDHVNKVTSNISKSVGVMRRLHCQFPANVMVKLHYSLVYSHLTYAWLAWGRSGGTSSSSSSSRDGLIGPLPAKCRPEAFNAGRGFLCAKICVLTGEHVYYSQIITKRFSLFTQFMITLLY